MLELINVMTDEFFVMMHVIIEGNMNKEYALIVDKKDLSKTVHTEIPEELKMYERQAKIALMRYEDGVYPEKITSSWY